ncbi:SDR family NAD(P)-dependent oxidoreductase [Rhizobium sp. RCAM05973]|uniref:SDR family NAD(P)-dependent oxidoreductase n=1 Tax=Rhizobium sp. RCAM05973 TaxID=2994066 RepID=UPI0022EBF2E2|nr:SDR family NAD(P)-dependent oxidoreductase [Rhizobium sp. RCAM05973]
MKNQTMIVTGGGSGLGKAVSLGLSAEGARVAIIDIDPKAADAVVAEIESSGGAAFAIMHEPASREGVRGEVGVII